jgi:hypothetical protein
MDNQTFVLIIIGVLLLLFAVIIVIILIRSSNNTILNNTTVSTGVVSLPSLLQPCSVPTGNTTPNQYGTTGVCNTGLVCANNNICLAEIGTLCNNYTECVSSATSCSGRCVSGITGFLGASCPCPSGGSLTCTPQSNGYDICLTQDGYPCTTDSDCIARCINGICSSGLSIGEPCLPNQCATGLACNGQNYCQLNGIDNGAENAYCDTTTPALVCDLPLVCTNNFCASSFSTLGTNCSNSLCNLPLLCQTQPPVPPATNQYTICVFPNNNQCNVNCVEGFNCVGTTCIAETSQACNVDANCASGNCTSNNSLFYWNGNGWNNISTTPSDTYSRLIVEYSTGSTPSNVYLVGINALRYYNYALNKWTVAISSPTSKGVIIDACIDHNNNPYLLINTGTATGVIVTDINLNPISNFGTSAGNLIIGGSPVPLNSIDIDINHNVLSTDTSGNLYINSTSQGNLSASKVRNFGNYLSQQNYAYIYDNDGIKTVGQLNNNSFPLFPINNLTYDKIADYSIHVENSTSVPTSVSSSNSNVYAIASPDGVNYEIIENSGGFQTMIPSYVNSTDLIGTNGPDLYLFATSICL